MAVRRLEIAPKVFGVRLLVAALALVFSDKSSELDKMASSDESDSSVASFRLRLFYGTLSQNSAVRLWHSKMTMKAWVMTTDRGGGVDDGRD